MRLGFIKTTVVAVSAAFLGLSCAVAADPAEPFEQWLESVRLDARKIGISDTTLDAAFAGIAPIPRVIELDRKQPEFTLTLEKYLNIAVTSRLDRGREVFAENAAILEEIGRKYGVQPRFIVALWGIETRFGKFTGGFPVVHSLATLAHDGRRSTYFRGELMNALRILDQGHIKASDMKGSWAGAMGQCQFMPSSFLNFAVDYDGDGHKDIWTTLPDVLASAANYLARSGWRDDLTWGRPVRLPANFDRSLASLDTKKSLPDWQRLGVRKIDGTDLPTRDIPASVVIPETDGTDAFIVYENYRTILKWNRSNFFAVAVGTLADRLQRH